MRWPLVTRKTAERMVGEARRETRQRIVDHLRQNGRGLWILDNVYVGHTSLATESFHVLGERNTFSGITVQSRTADA